MNFIRVFIQRPMEFKMNTLILAVFICSCLCPSIGKEIVKRDINNFLTDILDSLLAEDANNQSTTTSSSTYSTTSWITRYSSSPGATQTTSTLTTTTGNSGTTKKVKDRTTSTSQGTSSVHTTTSAQGTTSPQTATSAQGTTSSTASAKTTNTTTLRTATTSRTTTLAGSTTTPPPSSSPWSKTSTVTTTTTTTDNPNCHTKKLLSDVCNAHLPGILKNANIWDIYYMLFLDSILEALLLNCPSGKWCLRDEFSEYKARIMEKVETISSSEAFSLVCKDTTLKCIQEATEAFKSCDVSPTINFTSDVVSLLCGIQDLSKVGDDCLQELLVSFHVSIMDIIRGDFTKPDLNQDTVSVCDSTEAKMTKTYMCTTSSCPALQDKLSIFKPWLWFLSDVPVIQSTCSIPVDICQSKSIQSTTMIDDGAIAPSGASTGSYDSTDEPIKSAEDGDEESSSRTIFIGVSAGVVFAVVVLFTITIEYCRRIKKEESKKEGYKPLISKEP